MFDTGVFGSCFYAVAKFKRRLGLEDLALVPAKYTVFFRVRMCDFMARRYGENGLLRACRRRDKR